MDLLESAGSSVRARVPSPATCWPRPTSSPGSSPPSAASDRRTWRRPAVPASWCVRPGVTFVDRGCCSARARVAWDFAGAVRTRTSSTPIRGRPLRAAEPEPGCPVTGVPMRRAVTKGMPGVSVGATLSEARVRAGLTSTRSQRAPASGETLVEGIERDDYHACGGDFYARGHVKSIAHAVRLDPGPLLAEFDAAHRDPEAPTASGVLDVTRTSGSTRAAEGRRPNWTAAMAVALLSSSASAPTTCSAAGTKPTTTGSSAEVVAGAVGSTVRLRTRPPRRAPRLVAVVAGVERRPSRHAPATPSPTRPRAASPSC